MIDKLAAPEAPRDALAERAVEGLYALGHPAQILRAAMDVALACGAAFGLVAHENVGLGIGYAVLGEPRAHRMADHVGTAFHSGPLCEQIEKLARCKGLAVVGNDVLPIALPGCKLGCECRGDGHGRATFLGLPTAGRVQVDAPDAKVDLLPGEFAERRLARCGPDREHEEAPPVLAGVARVRCLVGRGVEECGKLLEAEGAIPVREERLPLLRRDLGRYDEIFVPAPEPVHGRPDAVEPTVDRPVGESALAQRGHELELLVALELPDVHVAPDLKRIPLGGQMRIHARQILRIAHVVGLQRYGERCVGFFNGSRGSQGVFKEPPTRFIAVRLAS